MGAFMTRSQALAPVTSLSVGKWLNVDAATKIELLQAQGPAEQLLAG
jgi:hypothetical protein